MAVSVAAPVRSNAPAAWRRRFSLAQDAALVCVSAVFFDAHLTDVLERATATNLFFALEQGLLVGIFLTRRRTDTTSRRPLDWAVATIGGWGPLAMRPHEAGDAAAVGSAIQLGGLILVTLCFLSLGKSFGVVAANRGLKVHGPYRLIRHPIYFAHAVTQVGFLVANPWWPNFAIFFVVSAFQVLRIRAEERVLSAASDYASYAKSVRWRLIPGLF